MHLRTNRATGLVAALATTAALAGAGQASAAVTKTNVTTPTSAFDYTDYDVMGSELLTVSGTSNGTTGDEVTLYCTYADQNYNDLADNVPVEADGSFSQQVPKPSQQTCVIRALPSNNVDTGTFAAYPGPTVGFGTSQLDSNTNDPNGPTPYNYRTESSTRETQNDFVSLGDCALADTNLLDAGFGDHNGTWDCNAYFDAFDYSTQTSSLVVDGHPALVPANAVFANNGVEGIPALTADRTYDAATGQWTINETDPAVFCADVDGVIVDYTAGNPNGACDHYIPAGVSIERKITETAAARVVSIVDSYSATDATQHAVTSYYENDLQGDTAQFPGEPGLEQHGGGEIVDLSGSSTGTIYTQEDRRYLPGTKNTQGALSYTSAPTRAIFSDEDEFVLQYDRAVPATGSVTIPQTYSVAFTRDQIQAQANELEDGAAAPVVAFTSPAAGTVVNSDAVSVAGTTSDNVGVKSLKVNGLPTTINPDGTWSQRVSLTPGANTVTAVATDASGNASQAQLSVVSSVSAASPACVVPDVKGMTRSAAGTALEQAGCTLGTVVSVPSKTVAKGNVITQGNAAQSKVPAFFPVGLKLSSGKPGSARVAKKSAKLKGRFVKVAVSCAQSAGSTCAAKLTLRTAAGRFLGSRVVTVKQGKSRTVSIHVSRRNAVKLRKAGSSKVKIAVTPRNGGTKSSRPVTLKG